jgi:hypothetical protein
MQGPIAGPAGTPCPVGEPGCKELCGVIDGQRAGGVAVEMDQLSHIIEGDLPALCRVEHLQPVEGRCRTIGQPQPAQDLLQQVHRKFFGL